MPMFFRRNYLDVHIPLSPTPQPYIWRTTSALKDVTERLLDGDCEMIETSEPTMFPTNEPTQSNLTQFTSTPSDETPTTGDNGNEKGETGDDNDGDSNLIMIIIIISVVIVVLLITGGVIYYCKYMKTSSKANETQMTNF